MNGVRTGTKTAKIVLQSGASKKNKYVRRGVMERRNARHKEDKQMKISREHGIWVLRIQERHFYFPSLSELIYTVRKIVDSL